MWKCVAPGGIHKAIKFVYGNLNALDGDDARAVQELKALERVKQVRHPFVVSIEQIQDIAGELVIVMELADQNLHEVAVEYQAAGRPGIPRDILLGFLDDAAIGLDHLIEKHNLQHLDVKPRNLFTVADRVKVADFGLVKQLERSSSSGLMGGVTPIYAAPETFQNKISKHSDQYSLAIVYVELLTGKRPFPGKNTVNPASIFFDHVLVKFGETIYDPSYGVKYASMTAFENAAIAGFVTEKTLREGPRAGQVNADLDGDGHITAGTEVVVFLFRQNSDQEQDLI